MRKTEAVRRRVRRTEIGVRDTRQQPIEVSSARRRPAPGRWDTARGEDAARAAAPVRRAHAIGCVSRPSPSCARSRRASGTPPRRGRGRRSRSPARPRASCGAPPRGRRRSRPPPRGGRGSADRSRARPATAARWRAASSRRHPQSGQPGRAQASTSRWWPFRLTGRAGSRGTRRMRGLVSGVIGAPYPIMRSTIASHVGPVEALLGDHLGAVTRNARSQDERHVLAGRKRVGRWLRLAGREPGAEARHERRHEATPALRDIHPDGVDHVPAISLRVAGAAGRLVTAERVARPSHERVRAGRRGPGELPASPRVPVLRAPSSPPSSSVRRPSTRRRRRSSPRRPRRTR